MQTRLRPLPLLLALTTYLASTARAELRFAQTTEHLKATATDQTLTTRFPFQNTGTDAIFLASLTTSCPCTTAHLEKPHVAPGENAVITVTYKIGASEGPQSQTVTLLTNEKTGTAYTLTLKIDIPRRATTALPRVVPVTPTLLFWSKKPFATKTVRVDLRELDGAKVSATCTSDAFTLSLRPASDAALHEAVIAITPAETATVARAELHIVIEHGTEKITPPPVALTLQPK